MVIMLSILAHVLSDFIVQTENIVLLKENRKFKGFFYHWLSVALVLMALLITIYQPKQVLIYSLIISTFHIIIDYVKVRVNSQNPITKLSIFLTDQAAHLMFIVIFSYSYTLNKSQVFINHFNYLQILDKTDLDNIVVYLILLVYLTFGGSILIRMIMDIIYQRVPNYLDIIANCSGEIDLLKEAKVGKYIGILERIIIFCFLIYGQLPAIGFVIAAKSLTRFKQLEKKEFAEYYLIGTLLSVVLTLVAYFLYLNLKKVGF